MKAMMGSVVDPHTLRLMDEIRVLRARVAELEEALSAAEAVRDEDAADVHLDVTQVLEAAGGR